MVVIVDYASLMKRRNNLDGSRYDDADVIDGVRTLEKKRDLNRCCAVFENLLDLEIYSPCSSRLKVERWS